MGSFPLLDAALKDISYIESYNPVKVYWVSGQGWN